MLVTDEKSLHALVDLCDILVKNGDVPRLFSVQEIVVAEGKELLRRLEDDKAAFQYVTRLKDLSTLYLTHRRIETTRAVRGKVEDAQRHHAFATDVRSQLLDLLQITS